MKTVADRTATMPLNPVLLLPTFEPVEQVSLLAAVSLDEERVLRWIRWCEHWDAIGRAEPTARSLTFADDTVEVFLTSVWRGDGEDAESDELLNTIIADSRALDTAESDSLIVFDAEREIGGDRIRWAVELTGAPYRIATADVSRAQLLGFLCRVCSDAELPRRFADLMSTSAALALDLVEHGARLPGEPAGNGRRLDQTLTTEDLLPALESSDPELRQRAMGLLSKLGRATNSTRRR